MKKIMLHGILCLLSGFSFLMMTNCTSHQKNADAPVKAQADPLKEAVANSWREKDNVARDTYRHPYETLKFFEVEPDMQVVEISPGKGWYTEILGPYLKDGGGKLYLAAFSDKTKVEYFSNANKHLKEKVKNNSEAYGDLEFTTFELPTQIGPVAPKGSVDRVLTFRNVHNWTKSGKAPQAFKEFYAALKPGGILGVVEHRVADTVKNTNDSGYLKQKDVIKMAEAAGFEFVEASEVNANPKDKGQYPKGVWTLPPTLRLGEKDKAKYLEIGESDRMTLKFKKPETTVKK